MPQPTPARATPATKDTSSGRPACIVGTPQTPRPATRSNPRRGNAAAASHVQGKGSKVSIPFAVPTAIESRTSVSDGGVAPGEDPDAAAMEGDPVGGPVTRVGEAGSAGAASAPSDTSAAISAIASATTRAAARPECVP